MQECKVFFPPETSEEQALAVLRRYYSKATIDTFQAKRQIGANILTFAITTLPIEASTRIMLDKNVTNIEIITSFAAQRTCESNGGGCGCKP